MKAKKNRERGAVGLKVELTAGSNFSEFEAQKGFRAGENNWFTFMPQLLFLACGIYITVATK